MKWHRLCSVCKHRNDFDPLVDECPFSQNTAECDRKLLKEIREGKGLKPLKEIGDGQGLVLIPANANPAELDRKPKKRRRSRPVVLPEPMPYYDRSSSQYPDRIRVSFADGHTEIYDRRISYPTPGEYVNYPQRRKKG